jgi:hypothetical protein
MRNEIDILVQALEANLEIFNQCKNKLTKKEQEEVLYPIILQLHNLCETCIPVLKPNN